MPRTALVLFSLAILVWAAGPEAPTAVAQAPTTESQAPTPHVDVGIGDPSPSFFDDPRFQATGIRHARLIVPYDVVQAGSGGLAAADAWLAAAQRQGVEPLVTFAHADGPLRRRRHLPSVGEYAAGVREFRDRYPWVREYATWNEANLPATQPTGRHPRRTAAFYRALRRQCEAAGCRVVAVELLLQRSWRRFRWLRRFREAAGRGPHVWGIHNYPDVTRLRFLNTGIFLRKVPRDEVWFTETGGIVRFAKRWPHDERRAARAVRHVFRMAAVSPRIKRVYLYNWNATPNPRWDSGFISIDGIERRAFFELLDGLSLERFRPAPPPIFPDSPPESPIPIGPDEDD